MMLRLMAAGMALPTLFAAWAGTQLPRAQAAPAQVTAAEQTRIVGCLARQTPDGAAPTPEQPRNASMPFVLTRARVVDAAKTAVPGTGASTNDTGTIAGAIAQAPAPGLVRERSFTLTGGDSAMLAKEVGQRIEVVGVISRASGDRPSAPPASGANTTADTAHPSAPAERLTVVSFRPVGGACL